MKTTATINVKTDKKTKEEAVRLADFLGIPLSGVINAYLRDFIKSGTFTVNREKKLKPSVKRELVAMVRDSEKGKNMSPGFTNAEDAIRWLNS